MELWPDLAVLLQAVGQAAGSHGGFLFCKRLHTQARRPVEEMLVFFPIRGYPLVIHEFWGSIKG